MKGQPFNTSDELESLMMGTTTSVGLSGSQYLDGLKDLNKNVSQPIKDEQMTLKQDAACNMLEFDYTLLRLKKELLTDSEDDEHFVIQNYQLKQDEDCFVNDEQCTEYSNKQSHAEVEIQKTSCTPKPTEPKSKVRNKQQRTRRSSENANLAQFPREIKCSYCNAIFTDVCLLDRHLRAHIGRRDANSKGIRRPYQCHFCGKRMNTEQVLEKHLARFHPSNAPNDFNQRASSKKAVECVICHQFVPIADLTDHINAHKPSDGLRFQCEQCCRSYKQKQTLRVHIKRHHENCNNTSACAKRRNTRV